MCRGQRGQIAEAEGKDKGRAVMGKGPLAMQVSGVGCVGGRCRVSGVLGAAAGVLPVLILRHPVHHVISIP